MFMLSIYVNCFQHSFADQKVQTFAGWFAHTYQRYPPPLLQTKWFAAYNHWHILWMIIGQCCYLYTTYHIFFLGAVQQLEAIASHINEQVRQQENSIRMLSIQNSLTGKFVPGILAPGRRFIREGRLMKVLNQHFQSREVATELLKFTKCLSI